MKNPYQKHLSHSATTGRTVQDVATLGQVFTPERVVSQMFALRKNFGNVLEPSCGDGAFSNRLTNCTAIELDSTKAPADACVMDFFNFPTTRKFDTIIGNPPYVRYQDIAAATKRKLDLRLFDARSNLYLFFIEKCLRHLKQNGELIFITPRDFLKATSSRKLNELLYKLGTITDFFDLGDERIFAGFSPNCAIWRFELGNFTRRTNVSKNFMCANGQLMFTDKKYPVRFSDVFFVKVGAVSGCDEVFTSDDFGNREFVCSETYRTGQTRRMIYDVKHSSLEPHRQRLLGRRIKQFDNSNWWQWGRRHFVSGAPRIYVNCKTRDQKPFFLHQCNDYDGSVLAVFPRDEAADAAELCQLLNAIDWTELGFVCDGRFVFSQRSLEQSVLPGSFSPYIAAPEAFFAD